MIIDKEFKNLLPPLDPKEYENLKESILEEGCREALIVWNGILIDGHNRYEICTENNIPFDTKEIAFSDKEEAKIWIFKNQISRRNIKDYVRAEFVTTLEESIRARAKEQQKRKPVNSVLTNKTKQKPINTRKELADIAGVSEGTFRKAKVIMNEGTEEQKERARKGASISSIYNEIRPPKAKADNSCLEEELRKVAIMLQGIGKRFNESKLTVSLLEDGTANYCNYRNWYPIEEFASDEIVLGKVEAKRE